MYDGKVLKRIDGNNGFYKIWMNQHCLFITTFDSIYEIECKSTNIPSCGLHNSNY